MKDLDPDIFIQAAETLFTYPNGSNFTCNLIDNVSYRVFGHWGETAHYDFYQELFDVGPTRLAYTMESPALWPELNGFPPPMQQLYEIRLLCLCLAAAVVEWEQENIEFEFGESQAGHSHYVPSNHIVDEHHIHPST